VNYILGLFSKFRGAARVPTVPVIAIIAAVLTACSTYAGEGGVSGGGGGVVQPQPVDISRIEHLVDTSRLELFLFFNEVSHQERESPQPRFSLLFNGERTIFDVLKEATIEVKKDGPCIDPSREEKDGAAPGTRPDSICISLFNLAQKLNIDNYHAQTVALMGHEFAHLLGADETAAVSLQQMFLGLASYWPRNAAFDMRVESSSLLQKIVKGAQSIQSELPSLLAGDPERLDLALNDLLQEQAQAWVRKIVFGDHIHMLDASTADLWFGFYRKVQMLEAAACARDPRAVRRTICKEILDRNFGADSSLTLPEFESRVNGSRALRNPQGFAIHRITADADFATEMSDVVGLLTRISLWFHDAPGFWTGNPDRRPRQAKNRVSWRTSQVSLSVEQFRITASGIDFLAAVPEIELHSDPGTPEYWTFESNWKEYDREMRLFIYFVSDGKTWWADEIRIYDGSQKGEWIRFRGRFFETPIGGTYRGDLDLSGISDDGNPGSLTLGGLELRMFQH
jgi:hypothetical protein